MHSVLSDVYYNLSSPACYGGINAIHKEAKKRLPSIKQSDVESFLQKQDTYTLHKPARRNFPRKKTIAICIDSDWQADLCDLQKLAKHNDGYRYILTVIDVLSKYSWAVPIKNKTAACTADGFAKILNSTKRRPWRLYTDKGEEFRGKQFQDLLEKNLILHICSESPDVKAAVAERYNKTLKHRLWRHFTTTKSYRYLESLPAIVDAINHSYHSTIKCRPVDVTKENEQTIRRRIYGPLEQPEIKFKLSVGDKVRVSKYRGPFKKGYLPNFTEEIFIVTDRSATRPPTYTIKDLGSEPVLGIYYEQELAKVVKPDEIYKIEKILKTRKHKGQTEHFVKWLGYPDKFNQWIKQTDLQTIA